MMAAEMSSCSKLDLSCGWIAGYGSGIASNGEMNEPNAKRKRNVSSWKFLSMKLANVNPELNVDIEQILFKDLLYPQGSNGVDPNPTHLIPETCHGTMSYEASFI